ncbi:S-methyl-5-thioribose kinase [Pseudogracilibacillus auburnensis]|uniref:S-methyl-5-thioribose kinase n=1 Tax=Pseudogracilibacillus auburnensis TaxID=1494959 RepID=UPI001A973DF2|nr:S-methyl-5-thioribose kinase [Pseudogracilibacillus auburnensis]MBO1003674.1 S-methyl-5-thioribose kinase [Pseudogracilibacillus auburnensis]
MAKFDEYFLMENEDVIHYVKEKTSFFNENSALLCDEIGDGNLNYVYRVVDQAGDKSVIVKQAGDTARISDAIKLSTNRIKIESDILILHGKLAKGHAPEVYLYDNVMNCCIMEDLSDHTILREALLQFETFPKLADHISTFMVQTLLPTTDVVMDHQEKKVNVKEYMNPELCDISEELVYTEPFNDYNQRNELFEPNKEWIVAEIYRDDVLRLEAAKLKFEFMNHAQALIHGDLHTGSLFVTKESTKVIDPEFGFYGPIGYDVGNIIANLTFALIHGDAYGKEPFVDWAENTIMEVVDLFNKKFTAFWDEHVTDEMAKEIGFKEWYLDRVLSDSAGVAGLEMIRRIVGLAKVKDITSIEMEAERIRAERICLTLAKRFIKDRDTFRTGKDFITALKEVMKKY